MEDRIKGMVFLSLYGDALGFPHEFKFNKERKAELLTKSEFLRPSDCNDPWACWSSYDQILPEQSGILSDDSFYKLKIQIPFLKKYGYYSDEAFAEHCLAILDQPSFIPAMKAQVIDWLYMLDQIQLPRNLSENIRTKIKKKKQTQSFYDPKSSACFGLFLFHWQAITKKTSTTNFDSNEGQKITRLLFNHLGDALRNKNTKISKSLKIHKPKYFTKVQNFVKSADLSKFSELRLHFYKFRQQLPDEVYPLKHNPLEFMICISIAELLFPDNPLSGLKLVSSSGGDSDTIGSIWGAIIGAQFGYKYLIEKHPVLEQDFAKIKSFLASQSIDLPKCIDDLISIADL